MYNYDDRQISQSSRYFNNIKSCQIIKIDNDFECEKYVNEIFSVAYSIGGDYGETTLRAIAETLLN